MELISLLEKLSEFSKQEIEYALLGLMLRGKIDFMSLQGAYVRCLEHENDKRLARLMEAETCVLEGLLYDRRGRSKESEVSVQRRLYLLNQSGRFNMEDLNGRLEYDPERAAGYNHEDDCMRAFGRKTN